MFDKCRLGNLYNCYLSTPGSPSITLFRLQTNRRKPLKPIHIKLHDLTYKVYNPQLFKALNLSARDERLVPP
jgi:hypothetical protein